MKKMLLSPTLLPTALLLPQRTPACSFPQLLWEAVTRQGDCSSKGKRKPRVCGWHLQQSHFLPEDSHKLMAEHGKPRNFSLQLVGVGVGAGPGCHLTCTSSLRKQGHERANLRTSPAAPNAFTETATVFPSLGSPRTALCMALFFRLWHLEASN